MPIAWSDTSIEEDELGNIIFRWPSSEHVTSCCQFESIFDAKLWAIKVLGLDGDGSGLDMDDVRDANRKAGETFFEQSAWPGSRVSNRLYGGRFFVTSERLGQRGRRYTVREACPGGVIKTASELGQYGTHSSAHTAARRMARG